MQTSPFFSEQPRRRLTGRAMRRAFQPWRPREPHISTCPAEKRRHEACTRFGARSTARNDLLFGPGQAVAVDLRGHDAIVRQPRPEHMDHSRTRKAKIPLLCPFADGEVSAALCALWRLTLDPRAPRFERGVVLSSLSVQPSDRDDADRRAGHVQRPDCRVHGQRAGVVVDGEQG